MSTTTVLQTVALPPSPGPWPTVDPFLFCVHHRDAYPAGTDTLGPPPETLHGREIGSDFAGADGWRMYHGDVVPGFPQHPHRGFETVTYVRSGFIDHSDSLGATARFGVGDTQWLTAGGGIVHSEMFPLVHSDRPNPVELFQIWVNLPAGDKLVAPHFTMLWAEDIPTVELVDPHARRGSLTVIAGAVEVGGTVVAPPAPPPASWASKPVSELAIWHLHLEGGAGFHLPPVDGHDTVRVAYLFHGQGAAFDAEQVAVGHAAVLDARERVHVEAAPGGIDILVLQGRPIGEPIARYGPFVMNDNAGIQRAFADYRRTGFGGWPFATNGPVHPRGAGRFARYPDGHVDEPTAKPTPNRVVPTT